MATRATERVILFIDYQNVYSDARRAFHQSAGPSRLGQIWPLAIGQMVTGRSSPGHDRTLTQVRVYRGIPTEEQDPVGNAACRRQIAAWRRDRRVRVFARNLKGPPGGPLREKGIDVSLAADFVDGAHRGTYDVGIIFSLDADFEPAIELVRDLPITVEVAAWRTRRRRRNRRLAAHRGVWCHWLDAADYQRVRDNVSYVQASRRAGQG